MLRIKSKEVKKNRRMTFHQVENINKKIEIIENEMEVLDFKSTITEMRNSLEGLNGKFEQVEEEKAANLETLQLKLSSLRKRKKKRNEEKRSKLQSLVGHHRVYIFIMETLEGEARKRSRKNTWWNLCKLFKFNEKSIADDSLRTKEVLVCSLGEEKPIFYLGRVIYTGYRKHNDIRGQTENI